MKKFYFLLIALLCAVTLSASAKKPNIAVFVTTDACYIDAEWMETEINGQLAKCSDWNVLTREDSGMDAICRELDIQRSGLVSDSQIMRIGQMCAAKYVFDAKIRYSKSTLKMTVRIINVETGKIEHSTDYPRKVYRKNPDWKEEAIQLVGAIGQKIRQEYEDGKFYLK